jgi:hypothetical protein
MRVIAVVIILPWLAVPSYAASGTGPGSSSCLKFALDYTRSPPSEEQYFIWAQGYMSAIMMMAPSSVDSDLNLLPASDPQERQMAMIRGICAQDPQRSYSHAVRALYRHLGGRALD